MPDNDLNETHNPKDGDAKSERDNNNNIGKDLGYRGSRVKRIILISAAIGLFASLFAVLPQVLLKWQIITETQNIGSLAITPQFLMAFVVFGIELFLASMLAVTVFSQSEENIGDWIIALAISAGLIITEIVAWWLVVVTTGPTVVIPVAAILLLFLASLLGIYGTWFWIWKDAYLAARRGLCQIWIPYFWKVYKARFIEILACFEWGVNESVECLRWGSRTTKECSQYRRVRITGLITLVKALVDKLGEWVCIGWTFIREFFCVIWAVIRTLFCIAWHTIIFLLLTLVGVFVLLLRLLYWC